MKFLFYKNEGKKKLKNGDLHNFGAMVSLV